jgi:hypothetical protein
MDWSKYPETAFKEVTMREALLHAAGREIDEESTSRDNDTWVLFEDGSVLRTRSNYASYDSDDWAEAPTFFLCPGPES